MMPTPPTLAYRRAATQQASVVGLVIALYDTLHGDLRRAMLAMQQGNIEERGRQLKHGFSVLTQLDSLLDTDKGGQTALNLRSFYSYLRQEMLQAQFRQDPSLLDRASIRLLGVRGAWQRVDTKIHADAPQRTSEGESWEAASVDCQA